MKKTTLVLIGLLFTFLPASIGQNIDNKTIKEKIATFKKDPKGPYQQIMWYCPDGSKVPPKQRCPEKGGVQRATYKAWVDTLAKKEKIYLGQILAATDFEQFLDEKNQFSRLKQYQIENYLEAIDNGWILRRARFYRGAFQDEDENLWGAKFLKWISENKSLETSNYFMLRQAYKDIPHMSENSNIQKVRALSMEIADTVPQFMDIRIKIHGQPDVSDLKRVKDFKKKNNETLSVEVNAKLDELIKQMEILYKPIDWQSLGSFMKVLGANSASGKALQLALNDVAKANTTAKKVEVAATLMLDIRRLMPQEPPKSKPALFDLSNRLEELIFNEITTWKVVTTYDILEKNYLLSMVAAGSGFIELWEWDYISNDLKPSAVNDLSLAQLTEYMVNARRVLEWSTAMIYANFGTQIELFKAFEPLAAGFSDDRIRSSVLLQLGQSVSVLGDFINLKSQLSNTVLDIPDQSHIRGINPGFSKGILVVAESSEGMEIDADKIYIFRTPPSDLKPVAGIATVTEGNLVSHVQLLARNLGIPNAVVSQQNLSSLKAYSGKEIFYAVSNKGTVIMKLASAMSSDEKALFEVKKRAEDKIKVPIDKMDLKQFKVLNLRQVNATSSGKICGPKAANLGQLKLMFPDNVVEGLVIPFGIFRMHMDQKMPGENITYWEFVTRAFSEAAQMEKSGQAKAETDQFLLAKLEILRNAILKMPLLPSFVSDFKGQFMSVLGKPIGKLPIFLRSDTNMEDLKDFTGAGLNLTLFNVVDEEKILQGIKQVWASPYSERSFRWRQSYLLNPENVFPSILVIPSVNVDYSGVLITKGVSMGTSQDLTVAFSKGVGGAVDGQSAEAYLMNDAKKNILIAPARETHFTSLPATGGTIKKATSFENRVLKEENMLQLRNFATSLKVKMNETKGMQGPFDVELGFQNDKLWLFQVRPFVENRNAAGALYLESISPKVDDAKRILFSEKIAQ